MQRIILVTLALCAFGCGESGGPSTAYASDDELDVCSCINEPAANREACGDWLDAVTDDEYDAQAQSCRAALEMPEDGPDVCFCLKGLVTDPEDAAVCESLVDYDMPRSEMDAIARQCGLQ